ncbi:hypothetical protein RN01_00865 [Cupriavidus sp. SHE]|jgi:hypothetical protein|uniref:SURP motif domain-containing protein n=2 Tax=Pseudomonadota TaxID=1224 RepID=A0A482IYS8_9BURK|nr:MULTISPECIES: hypothetical protein [Cupriavidus]KWR87004.1 hypothetical protein RN01_00865 [Cupriavidus sp. SHE]QBP11850.1 hypothetical protein DDF84_018760 [Cupriavidus metallidurans]
MFDDIGPVYACSDVESAASIANRALLGRPLTRHRKYSKVFVVELAYGTVSWPLETVAQLGGGLLGTVETLTRKRSVTYYAALSMGGIERTNFLKAVRTSSDTSLRRDNSRDACDPPPFTQACPRCEAMIWKDYGTRAQLVVHQPPFVEACVLDGYGLEPWVPGGRPPKHRGHGRQSSQGKIAFARDVMAVCEAAADLDGFVDGLRHKLHELDLINRSGRLNRMLLARMLASYVIKHYRGSALEQVFDVENACNPLYEFLRRPEYTAPPHYVVVLYALLRDTQPVTFVPADHTIAALQGTWGARTYQPPLPSKPADRNFVGLLQAGFSRNGAAAHCGLTKGQAERRLQNVEGLAEQWRQARQAVLRHSARQVFLRLHETVRAQPCGTLHQSEAAAYSWLMRHDQEWLNAHQFGRLSPTVARKVSAPHRKLKANDIEMALPHLAKTLIGTRDRARVRYPREVTHLGRVSGIPWRQLAALCRASPSLDCAIKALLQRQSLRVSSKPAGRKT